MEAGLFEAALPAADGSLECRDDDVVLKEGSELALFTSARHSARASSSDRGKAMHQLR